MINKLTAVSEFIENNRKALAAYMRKKLLDAGAKEYLDGLGNDGIKALDREAAGVLLDLACAFIRRLCPESDMISEEVLAQLPENVQQSIRLPRSDAYHTIVAKLPR